MQPEPAPPAPLLLLTMLIEPPMPEPLEPLPPAPVLREVRPPPPAEQATDPMASKLAERSDKLRKDTGTSEEGGGGRDATRTVP